MKKKLKKYLSIYLSIFVLIFNIFIIPVNAVELGGGGGYFTTDSFTFANSGLSIGQYDFGYYYMENDSNLPDTFHIYYKIADGKAECCLLSEITTEILNKKVGVTLSTDYLSLVIQNINNVFLGTSSADRFNISDFLDRFHPVCKNNTMVGISLNDIGGCRMVYSLPNDKIDVPSDLVNNIYNIFENYTINVNPLTPDWINVACIDNATAIDYLSYNTSSYQQVLDILNGTNDIIFTLNCNGIGWDNGGKLRGSGWDKYLKLTPSDDYYFTVVNSGDLNSYIIDYDLTFEDNTIELDELLTENHIIGARIKDISTGYDHYITEYNLSGTSVGSSAMLPICYYKCIPYKTDGGYITIYSSSNIPTRITNNTYSTNYYTSSTYNNFNTNTDNSYTTTVQNVNNSSTTNTNIYNQAKTTTNNNTTENNFTYNTTQNQTDITYIINYYYPDDSGGDDGGDDDDDETIWKALLEAIANFFKKIGELLAAILTGIVELFTEIVSAITNITSNMTALTDFLASIFSWLPTEIVSIITLGFALGVFICLIKLFK